MKLDPMKERDIDDVEAILKPITQDLKIRRRIKRHIHIGVCRIMRDEAGKVCALAMAIGNAKEVSLSYYWVREDKRRTFASLWLFMAMFPFFKGRTVYVYSRNISTFASYVEPTAKKNIYRFKGVGSNIEWDKMSALMRDR